MAASVIENIVFLLTKNLALVVRGDCTDPDQSLGICLEIQSSFWTSDTIYMRGKYIFPYLSPLSSCSNSECIFVGGFLRPI